MYCRKLSNGSTICDFADYRNFICFEHTTYLFEFSKRFGASWFSVPEDKEIDVDPNGHLSFLWDIFEEWHKTSVFSKTKAILF